MVFTKHRFSSKKDKKKKVQKKNTAHAASSGRGRTVHVALKQPFTLNGNRITEAMIEIDHINFGINKKTFNLNDKKRSDFSTSDIEKFLTMLDGEYLGYKMISGKKLRYEFRIDSPVPGKTFEKTYLMVFETDFRTPHLIHTVTLFRVGN